jgi:hypothetical protein
MGVFPLAHVRLLGGCRACNAASAGKATGSTRRAEEGLLCKKPGAGAVHAQCSAGHFRSGRPGLAESEREQARAKQHETGCGYCEKSFGDKVVVTHDAPADRHAGPNLLKFSESSPLQHRPRTIALISVRNENAGADEAEKRCNHLDHRNRP